MTRAKSYGSIPPEDQGTWINDGPSVMDDVPQELKDWAATSECKIDDPFSQPWYKLPVKHIEYAVKTMQRRVGGEDRFNDYPVPHQRIRSADGTMSYFFGQDPQTGIILWGMRED
jgi:hypothetical protein